MKLLASIKGRVLESGLKPDLELNAGDLWKTGRNVLFEDNALSPMPGTTALFGRPVVASIRGVLTNAAAGTDTIDILFGTTEALYAWYQASQTVVLQGSGYAGVVDSNGAEATIWSMENWGTWSIATNGIDLPQISKPSVSSGAFQTLSVDSNDDAMDETVDIFIRRTPFMLGIGIDGDGGHVIWCDADDVEQWTPAANNLARGIIIRDLDSRIRCALELRGEVALYSENKMFLVQFVGTPNVFGQRMLQSGIGAFGKQAVVDVGGTHYGVGHMGFWRTDGSQKQFIDTKAVRRYFFDAFGAEQSAKVCTFHIPSLRRIGFSYPTQGESENNRTLLFDYIQSTWTILDYGFSAADKALVFGNPVLGDRLGFIQTILTDTSEVALSQGAGIMHVSDTLEASAGYGNLGYGQGGYGGKLSGLIG